MIKKRIWIFIVALFAWGFASGQCNIDVTLPTQDTTICQGDSVHLMSDGSCTFKMNNTFNNSTIGAGWYSTQANPVFTNPCGQGPSGPHIWVGTTPSNTRTLVTQSYDVSSTSCRIEWWMRYGLVPGSGPCEDPDATGEGIHLQYSTNNGTTWTDFPGPDMEPVGSTTSGPPFNTTTPGSGGYWQVYSGQSTQQMHETYYWNKYENTVPAAAATPNTRFRWAQLSNSNQGFDAWGIDEVQIYCPGQQNVSWSHGVSAFDGGMVAPNQTKTYSVFIMDTSGNSATDKVTITVTPPPDPGLGPDTTFCKNPGNHAVLEADTGYDSYLWSTGDSTRTINVSSSGQYSVTVTDGNCHGSDSVNVTVTPAPTANAGPDKEICIGESTTLTADSVNGFYAWETGDSTKSVTVNPQQDTSYVLTVGTSKQCLAYDTVDVTVHPLPNADAGPDKEICKGGQIDLTGSGGQDYEWSTGDMVATTTVSPANTKDYIVTVTDINTCENTDTTTVTVHPLPDVTASAKDDSICLGDETKISGHGATSYQWDIGTGQTITVAPKSTQTYTVEGTDDNGCKSTGSVTVVAEDCSTFYISNAFSPDGNNKNDVFNPVGKMGAIEEYEMAIYDRWGRMIFKTQDPNEGWDGTIDGKPAEQGVYIYQIHYRSVWGKEFDKRGSVTLLR